MLQIDSTIDAKLIEALGRIVILWAYVEMLSGVVLAHLLRADDGAVHVVTQNVSHAAITDWVRTLVGIRYPDTPDRQAILDLLTDTETLRAQRNILVHGQWTAGPTNGCATVQTLKLERSEVLRTELQTCPDLEHLKEEIGDLVFRWNTLCAALKGTRV